MVIEQIISIFRTQMSAKDIKFKVVHDLTMPRYFIGDADRIQQLMLNLLFNAQRFLPERQGIIRVETSHLIGPEEFLQVSVGHNGPRIP